MPSDEAYQAVLVELAKLVEAWRTYREVINRAVSQLNHEVISFQKRLDDDDKARAKRQDQIDAKLQSITDGQEGIRRWQRARLAVEVVAVVVIIAFVLGKGF